MSDTSELPPELAALYASERIEAHAPAAMRDEVRVAIGATLGISIVATGSTAGAAGATSVTGASGLIAGTTTKLVLVFIVAGAIGGGAGAMLDRSPAPTARIEQRIEQRAVASPERVVVPTPIAPTAEVAPPEVAAAPQSTRKVAKPKPTPVDQRALIKQAWSELRRGDEHQALALVERAVASGAGSLDEERDALRVHLLHRLDRGDEATLLAHEFQHQYPNSIHAGLVMPAKESP